MSGTCSTHENREIRVKNVVGKPERKRTVGRSRSGWENNIIYGSKV
jgi:hypothetical protein